MNAAFYIAGGVAVASTFMVVTRRHAVHALLYLVVSFLAAAVVFFVLGAPFIAALEVIVYAGAIIVLFLFALMLLNVGGAQPEEREWLRPRIWVGPSVLAVALLAELVYLLATGHVGGAVAGTGAAAAGSGAAAPGLGPKQVGIALFGPYLLGVELASMLLLAGLVGAHRLTQLTETYEEGGPEPGSLTTVPPAQAEGDLPQPVLETSRPGGRR